MRIEKLDYDLPKELIAQKPIRPRDLAKLLVFDKKTTKISHTNFKDIGSYLKRGDLLIFNNTKVFPARFFAKNSSGKKIEIVFLSEIKPKKWEVIIGGRVCDNELLNLSKDVLGMVIKNESGTFLRVNIESNKLYEFLFQKGHVPLPPYIKRSDTKNDATDYQSVFAEKNGSAAAPTAGLHFTKGLISKLKNQGVEIQFVTLHVGLGTFAPIKTETVENHPIHSEFFEIDKKTAQKINKAKKEGRRIIACGTTVVRSLESSASQGKIKAQKSEAKIFIYPGYKFQIIDGLVTNFHTPRSSLLALVYAFVGEKETKKIYQEAINKKYRFFSYGDGMLII